MVPRLAVRLPAGPSFLVSLNDVQILRDRVLCANIDVSIKKAVRLHQRETKMLDLIPNSSAHSTLVRLSWGANVRHNESTNFGPKWFLFKLLLLNVVG